ncbi:hypothetical protein MHK_002575 [Candidatus Magnetomorum sp. HK-1]|nr:hypothetical protein MHK_002575 [Candidatus Magnetomorum sp. HK-1]
MIIFQAQDSMSAISIKNQNHIYDMINDFASKLKITKDQFVLHAIEKYINKYKENKQLLKDINLAYDDIDCSENKEILRCMKKKHKGLLEQW